MDSGPENSLTSSFNTLQFTWSFNLAAQLSDTYLPSLSVLSKTASLKAIRRLNSSESNENGSEHFLVLSREWIPVELFCWFVLEPLLKE